MHEPELLTFLKKITNRPEHQGFMHPLTRNSKHNSRRTAIFNHRENVRGCNNGRRSGPNFAPQYLSGCLPELDILSDDDAVRSRLASAACTAETTSKWK